MFRVCFRNTRVNPKRARTVGGGGGLNRILCNNSRQYMCMKTKFYRRSTVSSLRNVKTDLVFALLLHCPVVGSPSPPYTRTSHRLMNPGLPLYTVTNLPRRGCLHTRTLVSPALSIPGTCAHCLKDLGLKPCRLKESPTATKTFLISNPATTTFCFEQEKAHALFLQFESKV